MNQAGVWSFRTQTGIARVVDGSLRRQYSLRGFILSSYKRLGSTSILQHIGVVLGSISAIGPVKSLVESVLAGGMFSEAVSVGLSAVLTMSGVALLVSFWAWLVRPTAVDIYAITDVTVDEDDCELTIQYTDESDSHETTTVEVYDEDELDEAVAILQLKGAPVDETTAET